MSKTIMNIKTTGFSLLMVIFSMMVISNVASAQETTTKSYVKIQVDGLSCPFCAYGLEKNLKKVKGAKDVFISIEHAYATFNVPKDNQPTEDELEKIVKDAGFSVKEIEYSNEKFRTQIQGKNE